MDLIVSDLQSLFAAIAGADGPEALNTETRLQRRIEHLLAELDTLKASHTEAVAAAIEERERRLQEQQEHLRNLQAVMMTAADGIITVDAEGRIQSVNEQACKMFGYQSEELVGRYISILEPAMRRTPQSLVEQMLSPGAKGGGPSAPCEVEGRRKDGTVFPVELATSRVRVGEREIFAGIFRDITQRKLLETQLRQAQKLESIGQLAAGIAHEINTPTQYIADNVRFVQEVFCELRPVLETCQQLLAQATPANVRWDERLRDTLHRLQECAHKVDFDYLLQEIPEALEQAMEGLQRVAEIVRSMKEISHPGQERQPADINRLLEASLTVARNEWKYVADVEKHFAPDLPPVVCVPGECNQVFLNLIVNAAHAIAEKNNCRPGLKGRIILRTCREGNWVRVEIEDTGIGIRPEIQSRIFEPFFTTKPVGKGTGQGLAIARSIIVEKHKGEITFYSEVNKGTTFIVRLPIQSAQGSTSYEQYQKTDPVCGR
ncbi:MAG: PAS domain S-box protein [Thermoguttaceae bacterium]|nr:PAS domain S-box protein [Thermoguttaceae bacterium]MDW8039249.1 PAS domain S-box protein [Thermoguttaceae bacterium]